ncbi:hypothetical protein DRW03_30600 [Corallococcus sp. H22C18031201]|nr:hypothetical protein DRW03_30600 [Corallococcus sp. H22C18031201]
MLDPVIGPKRDTRAVDDLLGRLGALLWSGSIYVGYPLVDLPWQQHVDLLVASAEHGVTVLDLHRGASQTASHLIAERQATIERALFAVLGRSRHLLMRARLAVPIRIVTVDPDLAPDASGGRPEPATEEVTVRGARAGTGLGGKEGDTLPAFRPKYSVRQPSTAFVAPTAAKLSPQGGAGYAGQKSTRGTERPGNVIGLSDVVSYLAVGARIDRNTLKRVHAAVQRLGNARPAPAIHTRGAQAGPRAAVLAQIDREIVSLDSWQTRAALEVPEGPQRICGLAGSGKTVILAHKAAILHASQPHARIALTYHVRTLHDTFRELVTRFYREQQSVTVRPRDPDWTKLQILPGWGGKQPGIYAEIARHVGGRPLTVDEANERFGKEQSFARACEEVLGTMGQEEPPPLFDVVLIDEAQDLPRAFFEMVYRVTAPPKRVVWAYDDLQNLTPNETVSPAVLFGADAAGQPRVPQLFREEGMADSDVVLPVCYRNTSWALTVAHALGFGVYRRGSISTRPPRLVQFYADPEIWDEIGYVVESGQLLPGWPVTLVRDPERSPAYFSRLLTPADAVQCHRFDDVEAEAAWVAEQIEGNLAHDGLVARQILIVSADPYFSIRQAIPFVRALQQRNIESHEARGDAMHGPDRSVPIAIVNRAKGNEAPMVYVVQSEHAATEKNVLKRRNAMFTAITRSRAWVRITGSGDGMRVIEQEVAEVVSNDYRLRLTVPTRAELARMERQHRRDRMQRQRGGRKD